MDVEPPSVLENYAPVKNALEAVTRPQEDNTFGLPTQEQTVNALLIAKTLLPMPRATRPSLTLIQVDTDQRFVHPLE